METSNQEQANGGIEVVNARLNYLAEATPRPVNYTYDPRPECRVALGNTLRKTL